MSHYDIHPHEIGTILLKTENQGKQLSDHTVAMVTAGSDVDSSVGSPLVKGAFDGLFQRLSETIKFCSQRTSDAITGCSKATLDYIEGDENMARNAITAASHAKVPTSLPGLKGLK